MRQAIEATAGFPPDRAQALPRIVLSHHGRLEYGSPVTPCPREAVLVHAMDNLSGQLGAFDRLEADTPVEDRWSRHDRVIDGSAFLSRGVLRLSPDACMSQEAPLNDLSNTEGPLAI